MRKFHNSDNALVCSFCHKSQDVVGKLISSPSDYPRAYICDECIAVCNSILQDDRGGAAGVEAYTGRLIEAVRRWATASGEAEPDALAELRRLAQKTFVRGELDTLLALPAGADLDAAVHTKIFGGETQGEIPHYSTSIEAAWKTVEKFTPHSESAGINDFFYLSFAKFADYGETDLEQPCNTSIPLGTTPVENPWAAHFHFGLHRARPLVERFCARAATPALAICRAGLKACA